MRRAGLAVLVLLGGCRSSLELDGGRAYECARDGGDAVQCPHGWRCGDDGRCLDPNLGVARGCESAETGCGGGWKCGLEQRCFDPKQTNGPARACSESALHCYDGWRCGLDRICFDPASGGALDGGALRCTNAATHCPDGQRCGLDGLCFQPSRPPDAGAGPGCDRDDQCAVGWRCGRETSGRRLCQPVGVGGPYVCATDDDCEGWRCNPVELRCVDVREPLPPLGFLLPALTPRLLSPLPEPGEPVHVAFSDFAFTNPGGRFPRPAAFWVAGTLTRDAGLLVTLGTDDGVSEDGGALFVAERRRFPLPAEDVVAMAAGQATIYTLDSRGAATAWSTSSASGTPVPRPVIAMRQMLTGRGELVAITTGPDGGRELFNVTSNGTMLDEARFRCQGLTEVVDVALAREGPFLRAVLLGASAVCLLKAENNQYQERVFALDPQGAGRRLFTNFANDFRAFDDRAPTVSQVVFELSTDAGLRYTSARITAWDDALGLATLSPVAPGQRQQLMPPCPLCPGGGAPTEVVPLPPTTATSDPQVVARCPALTTDAGVLPDSSWKVTTGGTCANWSFTLIFDEAELRPHEEPVAVQQTSPDRRVLGGRNGQVWFSMTQPGSVARPLLLDHVPDIAIRYRLDPRVEPTLLMQTATRPFRLAEGIGMVTLGDGQHQDEVPVGTVLGQADWIVRTTAVVDVSRFPLGGQIPFQVAAAPPGVLWRAPVNATTLGTWLFVGAADTVYAANVQRQLTSQLVSAAVMAPIIVPAPGLPVRAMATRATGGAVPELWVIAGDGLFRAVSADGTLWVTQRLPLGAREGQGQFAWADRAGARLLTRSGEVVSLPTSVRLAAPPAGVPGRVTSAMRACDATWAIVERDGGAGLHVLGPSWPDGGLAPWLDLPLPSSVNLAAAQLRRTAQDLFVITRTGEVWDITPPPLRDGGCQ
ncbi:MAG: hypothetical protein JNJ54_00890 [Myxococcaceae bacterium]|nr:hypothetical protein [Myxococcaceae bacterium]